MADAEEVIGRLMEQIEHNAAIGLTPGEPASSADLIESLLAENAALKAEVERLKPTVDGEIALDDDKTFDSLHAVAWLCDKQGHKRSASTCRMAAAEIDRLQVEVERLTPKPMTVERAAELMNEIAYDGACDWDADEDGIGYVRSRSLGQGIGTWTAEAIARQIEREKGGA